MIPTVGLVNIHRYNFFRMIRSSKKSFLICNFAVERHSEDTEKNKSFIQNEDQKTRFSGIFFLRVRYVKYIGLNC